MKEAIHLYIMVIILSLAAFFGTYLAAKSALLEQEITSYYECVSRNSEPTS